MSNNLICLPKDYILIILCIIIGFTSWYIYIIKKDTNMFDKVKYYIDNIKSKQNNKIIQPNIINYDVQDTYVNNNSIDLNNNSIDLNNRIILENRDRKTLYDNFAPPERRLPEYQYPFNIKNIINIPSRGYPDNYQLMGIVIRDNTETAYNLYGRQTYPSSNEYEYYVQLHGYSDTNVKIPIKIKGNREITDDQEIQIIGTNSSKGIFKVKLYNYDTPRYNPYII